ncbi:MAG TPA: hypothetical protein VEA35_17795 [Ramlibacter sp.]|nr:hypothetical protein [Ramlibacter sp.]
MNFMPRSQPLRVQRSAEPDRAACGWQLRAVRAGIALGACLSGALGAALLNSFGWWQGQAQVTLALSLAGAASSGTLLLCWNADPGSVRRSVGYVLAAGLGAVLPLLRLG